MNCRAFPHQAQAVGSPSGRRGNVRNVSQWRVAGFSNQFRLLDKGINGAAHALQVVLFFGMPPGRCDRLDTARGTGSAADAGDAR